MKIILSVLLFFACNTASAQITDTLSTLKKKSFNAYYSKGYKERTKSIAAVLEKAFNYHKKHLSFTPAFELLVLDSTDWKTYSMRGAPYGVPHYIDNKKRLVVAAHDNQLWKSFLPPADKLPPTYKESIIATYRNKEGQLSSQAFFDLLAIHELGHAFLNQAGVKMQRQWLSELYCNIFLHSFIAEKQKQLLPALTLLPRMFGEQSAKDFKYTSLKDLQNHYNDIATKAPRNYGWYQCRWHAGAANIYDADRNAARKLWDAFSQQKDKLSDEALLEMLDKSGNKGVADLIRNWDKDTVL
ncbi:MAG: hypothetical protein EOP53_20755 [Sphingobacteriales bacterium]|nr:MAG: hypothetical protein EOP53_20755 [Sphingobacteriales bacterium]